MNEHVAVAVSGGGHRATAFGLGALGAVVAGGLNSHTVSINSVSGGSIANGVLMTGPDFATMTTEGYLDHITGALGAVSRVGILLQKAKPTRRYLQMLIGVASLIPIGLVVAIIGVASGRRMVVLAGAIVLAVGLVVSGWLLAQRSARTEAAIDAEMLGGRRVTLADVQRSGSTVHHVICTTELQTGEPFYFTNRAVYGYRFGGSAEPVALPLSLAVQASACVPGAFNPRRVPLSVLGVQPPKNRKGERQRAITDIVVSDGGVYDNMADQWEYGIEGRCAQWPELGEVQPVHGQYLIVVNGSGGWNDPRPVGRGWLAGEVAGLLRAQGVQYDVSTAHRRRALYDQFRASGGGGSRLDGAFVQITDSPYRLPRLFAGKGDPMAARAEAAIAFLDGHGYSEAQWEKIVARTSGAPTTLAALGPQLTGELFLHGYLLTTVVLHVLDDACPLVPIDIARLAKLCA